MPSPVQSNCDAHDAIANGQYGAVWSMGHTQQCPGSLVVMAGMSRVQAKYPPCRGTMHIKSVEFKRPPIGVVVRRGEFQLRCRP
ncbi:hypothetical protein TNCV_3574241 [Trichonephila clavipes]|nr:hypothetical protein TNCV_3574241 [Trichonephila clavipes]